MSDGALLNGALTRDLRWKFFFSTGSASRSGCGLASSRSVAVFSCFDLGVLHRKEREIGRRESLILSAFYIALGLVFGAWVWWYMVRPPGIEYLTGFVIEKSVAMDNVFVIAMIFGYFAIPRRSQYRVLFWGILGVIVLRAHHDRRRRGARRSSSAGCSTSSRPSSMFTGIKML